MIFNYTRLKKEIFMAIEMLRPVPINSEPKRKNRFYLDIPGITDGENYWMVHASSRPKATISSTEIPYMNVSSWVAGRAVWETLDITFIDCIGPSTSQRVMDWIRSCIEFKTGRMGYATNYKKQISLYLLDPAGEIAEQWTLYNAYIENSDFGDLDYSSDDLVNVTVTVRYDYAVLNY